MPTPPLCPPYSPSFSSFLLISSLLYSSSFPLHLPSYCSSSLPLFSPSSSFALSLLPSLSPPFLPFSSCRFKLPCHLQDEEVLEEEVEDGTRERTSTTSKEEVSKTMTTWGGGVEAAAVVLATGREEVEEWVASETYRPAEERQTSGNHLKRSVHSGPASS
ncbi:hypothetical protein ATANTOWER_026138 [Ataeniobius toweri]|uniref:Uncharacterized protein n=1 Tax=Ataeniobius toweri TaxID=208326 RepID=A0ABU7AR27_9TELE|nr:hypothetical protein [Ataeniobius toweri]